jgi:hypothetical protein
LLRQRQVRTQGKKSVLVQRLLDHDSLMADMRKPSKEVPKVPTSVAYEWPSVSKFRSLTSELRPLLPPITKSHLEHYARFCQGQINSSTLSAVKQGELLSDEKVPGMSHCFDEEKHYFSGTVEASMKKDVIYIIKLILTMTGDVLHSSCECAAGAGPSSTCKHVMAGIKHFPFNYLNNESSLATCCSPIE